MPESPAKKTSSTGLAIYGEYLYFVELDPEGQQVQKLTVKLPEGCISGNSIADFTLLAEGFTQIHKAAGNIREPVNIGIPSGDAAIRILTLPRMSLDDIRGTLDLNFEEYFPFSRLDAVFDVLDVRMPGMDGLATLREMKKYLPRQSGATPLNAYWTVHGRQDLR